MEQRNIVKLYVFGHQTAAARLIIGAGWLAESRGDFNCSVAANVVYI